MARPSQTNRGFPRWLGVPIIFFGVLMVASAFAREFYLLAFGSAAQGVVEVREVSRKAATLHVRYPLPSGERILFRDSESLRGAYEEDDAVAVRYIPGDPGRAAIVSASQFWVPLAIKLALGVACLRGGWALLRRKARR